MACHIDRLLARRQLFLRLQLRPLLRLEGLDTEIVTYVFSVVGARTAETVGKAEEGAGS